MYASQAGPVLECKHYRTQMGPGITCGREAVYGFPYCPEHFEMQIGVTWEEWQSDPGYYEAALARSGWPLRVKPKPVLRVP